MPAPQGKKRKLDVVDAILLVYLADILYLNIFCIEFLLIYNSNSQ